MGSPSRERLQEDKRKPNAQDHHRILKPLFEVNEEVVFFVVGDGGVTRAGSCTAGFVSFPISMAKSESALS